MEKKKLSLDEQIKLLEQTGYLHYPPRVDESPVPNAGTSPVSPSNPHPIVPEPFSGSSVGRGNPHGPTDFMLPRVPGANAPSPPQETGSNLPGSSIHQAPPVTQQVPPMLGVLSQDAEPTDPKVSPGRGNIWGPRGSLGPRTPGGQPANDPDVLAKALGQQLRTPIEEQTKLPPRSKSDIAKGVS